MDTLEQEIARMQMELDLLRDTKKGFDSGAIEKPDSEVRDQLYARMNMLHSRIEARKRMIRKGMKY